MKRLIVMLALAAALLPPVAFAEVVDGVAARVNADVILRSDVRDELHRRGLADGAFGAVLDELIDRQLILKAAADSKLEMQDWMVESRVREIVDRNFGGDESRLTAMLRQQKIVKDEWRRRLKEDMTVAAMRYQTVERNLVVSPGLMREEFNRNRDKYREEARVTVSVILLKPADVAKRNQVSEELKTKDFADVARRYSADSHARDGGVWKDVKPEKAFKPEVCVEIAKMPKGTLSKWIDIDGWSFLLRKDKEASNRLLSFAEAYEAVEANVRRELSQARYREWLERLRAAAYVKIYAD